MNSSKKKVIVLNKNSIKKIDKENIKILNFSQKEAGETKKILMKNIKVLNT